MAKRVRDHRTYKGDYKRLANNHTLNFHVGKSQICVVAMIQNTEIKCDLMIKGEGKSYGTELL